MTAAQYRKLAKLHHALYTVYETEAHRMDTLASKPVAKKKKAVKKKTVKRRAKK